MGDAAWNARFQQLVALCKAAAADGVPPAAAAAVADWDLREWLRHQVGGAVGRAGEGGGKVSGAAPRPRLRRCRFLRAAAIAWPQGCRRFGAHAQRWHEHAWAPAPCLTSS